MTEMMGARQRLVNIGAVRQLSRERREGDELADEDVAVPVGVLVAATHEQKRLAADDRAEALVHLRRDHEVDLRGLVLEKHEADAVRGRRPLARDDEARELDVGSMRLLA